ncbi:MAG: glycosyltransferase family 1 protein [Desulfobacteraceae bacterium]|nr:MAG: glycosyltransferase family 1 protein [Desulfobacteraceae bacterium]
MPVKKNKKITILFWGPLGKAGKTVVGGGESGNRRTIEMMKDRGMQFIEIQKPYPDKQSPFYAIGYAFSLLISVLKFARFCFLQNTSVHIAHVSGYYNHLLIFELTMLFAAKLGRIPFVYEIRGGAMLTSYQKRTFLYRRMFDLLLNHADTILIQGMEYANFVFKKSGRPAVYYPNYIDEKQLPEPADDYRSKQAMVEIIYFGRIVPDKGIAEIIHIASFLKKENFSFNLSIIGKGDKDYLDLLKTLCKTKGVSEVVRFSGPQDFNTLKTKIVQSHFFVFPTQNEMEGHSNAMTESMAFGVVPVCRDHGFNRSVVSDCGAIIPKEAGPEKYAQVIRDIWENDRWHSLSENCKRRIQTHFVSGSVIPRMENMYWKLANRTSRHIDMQG